MSRFRMLRILPPVIVAGGVAFWLISGAQPPARIERAEQSVTAQTMIARAQPVAPVLRGYGNVAAAQSWQAVAEVSGSVIWRHPDLETGNVIAEGTEVLRLDPTLYDLALAQAQADLDALRADQAALDVDRENTARLLDLEQERLAIAERDLTRARDLVAQGAAPQTRADEQERATLGVRRGVTELRNALASLPSRAARLEAQIARTEAAQTRARRDLDKTAIVAPFDLRVGQVHVERHQFAAAGQPLVSGDGTARAEVTAQLPIDAFPRLMGAASEPDTVGIAAMAQAIGQLGAEVRLVSDPAQVWTGRVVRIENALDPQARTVPVVVAVDDPYAGANPPLHLALVPNMYVELVLTAPAGAARIAVPDRAVHGGDTVYLRNGDGRLEMRNVTIAWRQGGQVVLADGLADGDEVVIDDITPAIPGMIVNAVEGAE